MAYAQDRWTVHQTCRLQQQVKKQRVPGGAYSTLGLGLLSPHTPAGVGVVICKPCRQVTSLMLCMTSLSTMSDNALQRRAMLGLPEGDTDPFFDTLPDQQSRAARRSSGAAPADALNSLDESSASDSDGEFTELEGVEQEPPELVAARKRLEAYRSHAGRHALHHMVMHLCDICHDGCSLLLLHSHAAVRPQYCVH